MFNKDRSEKEFLNPNLRCLRLDYFGLRISAKDTVKQLQSIFSDNLVEYCVSCINGSTKAFIKLKRKINKENCSFLRLENVPGSSRVVPTAFKVKNKKQCVKSLRVGDVATNISKKKEKKLEITLQSLEDLPKVDKLLKTLKKRRDIILSVIYPASTMTPLELLLKRENEFLEKLDPTVELLIPVIPGGETVINSWYSGEIERDVFSEQLFNLEKILHTIQTENKDVLISNLDSFGVRISSKLIRIERMKGFIDQFEQKMQSFLKQILLKNITKIGSATAITDAMFPIFLSQAGSGFQRMKKAKSIQLQLIYLLLYFSTFKITEISSLTKNNLLELMEKGSTNILFMDSNSETTNLSKKLNQMKKKLPNLTSYPMKGNEMLSEKLKGMQKQIDTLFDNYLFSSLGSNSRSKTGAVKKIKSLGEEKLLIKLISLDLKCTASLFGFPGKFSSCSFRKKT